MAKTALWTWALVLLFTWVSPAVPMKVKMTSGYSPAHPRKHINSICSTWGKDHFKTFDGDIYQFPGMCEYNLVSDCHEAYLDFSVHMRRTEVTGHPAVSRIVVTIKDRIIVLSKNLVTMNGEKITTSYYGAGISLERNTIYTKLQSKLGLSVMWNGEDAVTLELDSKYQNRTCGLCGDFNGIPLNFEFVEGGREISAIEFGNRQKVHLPTEYCEDVPEEDEFEGDEVEDSGLDKCAKFHDGCARLLQSDDWWSCTRVLSPGPYIQACMQDMCSCGDALDDFCICSTLAEYSRQCSHMGGTPPNWRSQGFCEKRCPLSMVYMESGSPCMDTCTNTDTSQLCEEHHMDGCVCPEGTVFDDVSERGCIRQEQCQCVHDKVYNSGEVLLQECEECVCIQGKWSCKSLPCPGQCAIEGGSHVTTYDGKAFTFHGDCYYILTKDQVGSKFTVLGQLAPCGSQDLDTCLKSVVLLLKNDDSNGLIIKADGKVTHNAEISLPYNTANVHVFRPSSFHIMLQTDFGLSLHIQLVPIMQLYITLDQTYLTKTSGLCGNFNKVLHDDLKTAQGLVEGTAASCANSWKAQTSCPNRMERLDDPCSLSIENENYAEHWCSMLQSPKSEFSKCHTVVDPEVFYRRCKYSTCNCEKSEDCLCAVFSSYVRACQAKGVDLQGWRTNICGKYMDTCPISLTFSYQLRQCQRTCRSLGSERPSCSTDFLPVDGCSCPEGLYQNDNGVCVPMAKCPCYHNGDHIKPGKSITIKEEHCVCTNGMLHCRAWRARSERAGCPSPKVFFSCSSANANVRGIECARTCSNLDGDCFSSECESGCQCPSGLLDDGNGNCVKEHDCPCLHDNQLYAPGRTIPDRCNTCTCTRGKWNCTDHVCHGACTIYGSGHHMTFDERTFGFRGDCGYVVVQDKCGNMTGMGNFRVITENIPCGSTGTTCSKAVRIYLGSTVLRLSDGKVEEITRNGLKFVDHKVRIVGLFIVVDSTLGISVVWDRKTTVRIILKPEHMGKVCGLCGDFDGDARDDFTTQGQLVVSSPMEFSNSWKVSACKDTVGEVDPCSLNPHRHSWAMLQCSIIKSTTFKDCHPKVDPILYYENCVSDSCACDSGGDCECFCTAVAAYAQACIEAGVCVAWRTPDLCPVYCDYFNAPHECKWHYSPCHTPCYKTCLNPQGICSNPLPNMEGCYPTCPPDKPIFDETNQICVEECDSCIINGIEYPPGAEVPTDELCTTCICMGYGNVTCEHELGCCVFNGTEYEEGEIIYNVTDNMGMCYYAICKNETIIHLNETCTTTPRPTTTVTSTTETPTPTTTPVSTTTTETPTPTTKPVSTTIIETPTLPTTTPVSVTSTETPTPTTTPVSTTTTETPTPPTTTPVSTTTTETPPPTTTPVSTTTTETPTPPTTTPVSTTTTETPTPTTTPVSTTTTETPTPTTTPVTSRTTEPPTPTTTPVTSKTTEPPTPTTTPVSTTIIETPTPTLVSATTTETPTPTTNMTKPPTTTPCIDRCEWSEWFDVDKPSKDKGDWETYKNITASGKEVCQNPQDIECRAFQAPHMSLDEIIAQTKQVVHCNISFGLICKKEEQVGPRYKCLNYEIRVNCCIPCQESTTAEFTTPVTSKTTETPTPTTTPVTSKTTETPTPPTTTPVSTTSTETPTPTTTPVTSQTTEPPTPTTTPITSKTNETPTPPTTTPVSTTKTETPTTTPVSTTTTETPPPTTTPVSSTTTETPTPTTTPVSTTTTETPTTTPVSTTTTETPTPTTTPVSTTTTETPTPTTTPVSTTTTETPTPTTTPVSTTTTETPTPTTTPVSTTKTETPTPTTTPVSTTTTETPTPPTITPVSTTTTETPTPTTTPVSTTTTETPTPTTTPVSTTTTETPTPTTTPVSTTTTETPTTTPVSTTTTETPTPTTTPVSTTTTETPTPTTTPFSTTTTETPTPTTTPVSTTTTETPTPPTTTPVSTTTTETPTPPTTTPVSTTTTETPTPTTTPVSTTTTETTTPTTTPVSTTKTETPTPTTTPVSTTTTETPTPTTTPVSTTTTETPTPTTTPVSTTTTETPTPTTTPVSTTKTETPTPTTTPVSTTTTETPTPPTITPVSTTTTETPTPPTTIPVSTTTTETPTPTTTPVSTTTTETPTPTTTPVSTTTTETPTPPTTTPVSTTTTETPTPTTTPVSTTTTETPTPTTTPVTSRTTEPPTPTTTPVTSKTTEPPTPTTTPVSTTIIETPTPTPVSATTTETPTPTTNMTKPPTTTPCIDRCEWSEWFDVDKPSKDKGDWETYKNITASGKEVCQNPQDIECRAFQAPHMSLDEIIAQTKQVVHCNISFGLICKKEEQVGPRYKCLNYEIRVNCCIPCQESTTAEFTTPVTSKTTETPTPTTTPVTSKTTETPTPPTTTPVSTTSTETPTPTTTPVTSQTTEPPTPTTTPITSKTNETPTPPTTTPVSTTKTETPTTTPVSTTTTETPPPTTTPVSSTTTETPTPTTTPVSTTTTETPTTTPVSTTTTETPTPTTTPVSTTTTETPTPTTTPVSTTTTETPTPTTTPVSTTTTETPTPTTTPVSTTKTETPTPTTTPVSTTTTETPTPPTITPVSTTTTETPTPTTTPVSTTTTETPTPTTTPVSTTTTETPTTTPVSTTTTETPTTTPVSTTTTETPTPTTTPVSTSTTETPTPTTTPVSTTTTETPTPTTTPVSTTTTETPTTTPVSTTIIETPTPPTTTPVSTTTTETPTPTTTPVSTTTTETPTPTTTPVTSKTTEPPTPTTTPVTSKTTETPTPPTTTPVSTTTTETPTPTTTPVSTTTTETPTPTTTPVSTTTTETPTTTPVSTTIIETPTPPTTTPVSTTTTETPTPTTTPVSTTTTETPTPTTTPVTSKTTEPPTPTTTPVTSKTTETPTPPTTTPVSTTTTETPTPTTTPVSTTTTETPTPPTTTPVSTTTTETPTPTTTPVSTTTTETPTTTPVSTTIIETPTPTPVSATTTERPTPTTAPVTSKTTEPPTPTTTPVYTTIIETPTPTAVSATSTETPTPTTTPVTTTIIETPTPTPVSATTTETPPPTTTPVTITATHPLVVTGRPPPTVPSIIVTTPCFCILNGTTYHPGATIVNMTHIGSGICLTMICSDVCKFENSTNLCPPPTPSTPTATPSTKPPGCPEWGVAQNETFRICNCTMAVCIEDNVIEIMPYKCPPLNEDLICTNGMKPVLEWDEYHCCQQYKCDCVCEGWGDPHYLTFDGVFYSFQGNCTYVLMEENIAWHKLKIYIDNVHCDPRDMVSCPRSIIVAYKADTFSLTNHNLLGVLDLEATINGAPAQSLPYLADNVKIINTGIDLVLEIPALNVVITYGITGFSIHLPFRHFGANTQGQCGTCNNNQADDCMLPGSQLVDCSLFGDYWVVEDLHKPHCAVPPSLPSDGPILNPTDKPCGDNPICDLLKSSLFAECHAVISPENFFRGCVFDSCHMLNPMVECTSLQTYAAACLGSGVCLDWRNQTDKCPSECPPDKMYKPCGPAEQPTCEDTSKDPSMRYMTEGCFCPDGMRLFNKESGVCVEKCGCLDPNGKPREFNEVFQYECQDCICDQATKSVTCKHMHCPGPEVISCNKPGFVTVNETNPANPCCSQLVCQCDGSTCPTIDSNCKEGYNPVFIVPEGGCCPKFTCEPKKVCVHDRVEYQPGASMPVSDCQECTCTTEVDPNNGLCTIKCSAVTCGQDCEPGFSYIDTAEDLCCGKCVQTHCMVQVDGSIQLLEHGHTWSPPGNKCEVHSCLKINGTFVSMQSNIRCPTFNESRCLPGTIQKSAGGCCDVCVEKERACKVESTKKHFSHGNCQSVDEVDVTYCEGACNTFTKYNAASVFMRQSCTCCQESRTSNRTVNLLCLNGEVVPHSYVHVEECGCKVADCSPLNSLP